VRIVELRGIAIRRREAGREHVAATKWLALPDHVAHQEARLRHLHGRDVAEALLDAGRHSGRIDLQSAALVLVQQQRQRSAGNQMGSRFRKIIETSLFSLTAFHWSQQRIMRR
jgi:hypothetical protein